MLVNGGFGECLGAPGYCQRRYAGSVRPSTNLSLLWIENSLTLQGLHHLGHVFGSGLVGTIS